MRGRLWNLSVVFGMFLAVGIGGAALADPGTDVAARLADGTARGVVEGDVLAWRGIPYAAAPVGPLRWRPPQPVIAWNGERDASKLSPNCIQGVMPGAAPQAPRSEDCLYLNVWRPAAAKTHRLPVLVWIHGGAFVNGGSTSPETFGDALARRGVVVVTFNYRLGRLGFFGHPGLSAEFPDEPKGNYGVMDQIAALQWLKRNIASFGGDPRNVTLIGESAGGIAINLLLGSPMAEGLFNRAIVMSGAGRDLLGAGRNLSRDSAALPSAEAVGLAFARDRGVEGNGAESVARLRALPAEQISGDLSMVTLVVAGERANYAGPIIDGRVISRTTEAMFRSLGQRGVPLMVGATSADLSLDSYASKDIAFARFGSRADAAKAAYDPEGAISLPALGRAIGGDRNMVEPARFVARAMAARKQPVFEYRFGYVLESRRAQSPFGADHASDVAFAFDRLGAVVDAPSELDRKVARQFADYIVNFARGGNPNGGRLPAWSRYRPAQDRMLDIGIDGSFADRPDPWRVRLDLTEANVHGR